MKHSRDNSKLAELERLGEAFLSSFEPSAKSRIPRSKPKPESKDISETKSASNDRETQSKARKPETNARSQQKVSSEQKNVDQMDMRNERAAFMSSKATEIYKRKRPARSSLTNDADIDRERFNAFQRDVEHFGVKGFDLSASKMYLEDKWVALGGKKKPGKAIPKSLAIQMRKETLKGQDHPRKTKPHFKRSRHPSHNRRHKRHPS